MKKINFKKYLDLIVKKFSIDFKKFSIDFKKYSIDFIYFTDESFLSMSKSRFEEFVSEYEKIKLPFFIESRVETIKPGYAKTLEKIGCTGVAMGVESGNLKLRKSLLDRMMPDEEIVNGFKEFEKTKKTPM